MISLVKLHDLATKSQYYKDYISNNEDLLSYKGPLKLTIASADDEAFSLEPSIKVQINERQYNKLCVFRFLLNLEEIPSTFTTQDFDRIINKIMHDLRSTHPELRIPFNNTSVKRTGTHEVFRQVEEPNHVEVRIVFSAAEK